MSTGSSARQPDLEAAVRLLHRRYSVPVVAVLGRDGPQGFTSLVRATGASREALSLAVGALRAAGLVERQGGPGRPHYALRARGTGLAAAALAAARAAGDAGVVEVALLKWSMPVLVAVGRGAHRFGEIASALPGITPRALAGALRTLADAGLVEACPPGATGAYRLTPPGAALFAPMDALVRACA